MEHYNLPIVDDQGLAKDTVLGNQSNNSTEENASTNVDGYDKDRKSQPVASTSNVLTLEPYSVSDSIKPNLGSQSKRKAKFRPDPTLIHFDHLFGQDSWSRFLILKTSSPINVTKLENILLTKCPSKDMTLRRIDEHDWLIEATTKNQSEIYQTLTNIDNNNVEIKRHNELNSIYGTVVLPDNVIETDIKLLLDSLQKRYQNIENLEVYEIAQRNQKPPLKIAKIKFVGQNLPLDIKIMGQKREIRPHLPKPLQCKQCSRYGHSTKKCRNDPVCAFCSSTEHSTKWKCGEMKCVNCQQNHHARSKECCFYIYNTELKLLMDRSGMRVNEAKLELKVRGIKDPAKSPLYRSAVKENSQRSETNQSKKVNEVPHTTGNTSVETVNAATEMSKNSFELLRDHMDEETEEMDTEKQNKGTKRARESSSPPSMIPTPKSKTLKSINDLKKSMKNTSFDNENLTDIDINPSPVLTRTIRIKRPQTEPQILNDNSNISNSQILFHELNCGCHECFMDEYCKITPLNKTSLLVMVRNFISNRINIITTDLETHQSGCLCIDHLKYYRENKIKILDRLLANQTLDYSHHSNKKNENQNTKSKHN